MIPIYMVIIVTADVRNFLIIIIQYWFPYESLECFTSSGHMFSPPFIPLA